MRERVKTRRTRALAGAVLAIALFASCGSSPPQPPNVTEAFDAHPCRSIHVFAPTNLTSAQEATEIVRKSFVGKLRKRGYRVGHPSDATMHVTIESWFRQIEPNVGGSRQRVRIAARLYDNDSGELLWSAEESAEEERDEDEDEAGSFLEGVVSGLLDYGFSRASESITHSAKDVAEDAVALTLSSLPRPGEQTH